jgi:hypothetical protein
MLCTANNEAKTILIESMPKLKIEKTFNNSLNSFLATYHSLLLRNIPRSHYLNGLI